MTSLQQRIFSIHDDVRAVASLREVDHFNGAETYLLTISSKLTRESVSDAILWNNIQLGVAIEDAAKQYSVGMTRRLSEAKRKEKYSYYATDSPLKSSTVMTDSMKKKTLQNIEDIKRKRERSFILDGVYEQVHSSNVVPSYNALLDPHAKSYFRQPAVHVMMRKTAEHNGQLIPPAIPSHKLSIRRRAPNTPGLPDILRRENKFIIDSVRADSLKSRRNPVIPKYDALNDMHSQSYFKKKSVRELLQRTCNIKI